MTSPDTTLYPLDIGLITNYHLYLAEAKWILIAVGIQNKKIVYLSYTALRTLMERRKRFKVVKKHLMFTRTVNGNRSDAADTELVRMFMATLRHASDTCLKDVRKQPVLYGLPVLLVRFRSLFWRYSSIHYMYAAWNHISIPFLVAKMSNSLGGATSGSAWVKFLWSAFNKGCTCYQVNDFDRGTINKTP